MKHLIAFLICFTALTSVAQFDFDRFARFDTVPVFKNGNQLKYPFAGGINGSQISHIDLNFDGANDIIIYDPSSASFKPFVHDGKPNSAKYDFAPEYINSFPNVSMFASFKDLNCDGKPEIITTHNYGMKVFVNESDSALKFRKLKSFQGPSVQPYADYLTSHYPFNGGYFSNVSMNPGNLNAYEDIDFDGDIDFLSLGSGIMIEYHLSTLVENNKGCLAGMETQGHDSLSFFFEARCWGRVAESSTCQALSLNVKASLCDYFEKRSLGPRHASGGVAIAALDLNGDSLFDILKGEDGCNNIVALKNTGAVDSAHITSQIKAFPNYGEPVDIEGYPAPFYMDVNNDGRRDLIIGNNAAYDTVTATKDIWYYRNGGTDMNPIFSLEKKQFLIEDMIDIGAKAVPTFINIDNDSLVDIVIGGATNYDSTFDFYSSLTYYKNIGTKSQPAYEYITSDLLNIKSKNLGYAAPCFYDFDDDGDIDVIIGTDSGKIQYFENIAQVGDPSIFQKSTISFDTIKNYGLTTPSVFDINNDGLYDLILGQYNGTINAHINSGAKGNPIFDNPQKINQIGGFRFDDVWGIGKANAIAVKIDTSGKYNQYADNSAKPYLMVANPNKTIMVFEMMDSALQSLKPHDTLYMTSNNLSFSIGDYNNDSIADLIVGEEGGGISINMVDKGIAYNPPVDPKPIDTTSIVDADRILENSILIWPNPTNMTLNIECHYNVSKISITSIDGQMLNINTNKTELGNYQIDVSNLPNGIYFVQVTDADSFTLTKKFIKQ